MKEDVIPQLQQIFRNVFDDPALVLKPDHTAGNIPGWDSLTHMTLIAEVETFFSVTFTFEEVSRFKQVGDLVQLISDKRH